MIWVFYILNAGCLRNVHEREGKVEIEQELRPDLIHIAKRLAHTLIIAALKLCRKEYFVQREALQI